VLQTATASGGISDSVVDAVIGRLYQNQSSFYLHSKIKTVQFYPAALNQPQITNLNTYYT
jgi:hypothetical protein